MSEEETVKHLIKRLSRIDASEGWTADLNPVQLSVLEYLSLANHFSRKPSHVAEFLGSTRGTVSQTLKSLASKAYVTETKSKLDKRSISYQLTDLGQEALASQKCLAGALSDIASQDLSSLAKILREVLEKAIEINGQRSFGICKNCSHFQKREVGGHCALLNVPLKPADTSKICAEQKPLVH